ncbi:hypothetical protein D3C72_230580 [compost metagenome]
MALRLMEREEEAMTDWPDSSLSGVSHSGNPNPEGTKPEAPPKPLSLGSEAWEGSQLEELVPPPRPGGHEPGDRKE